MIALNRLRLINWHNFADDTLDIRQITYLIGVNGVGKTTILDALRYCLTTSKNFNALGNRKSKRTLLGSVHGKQRDQDGDRPRYSRKGHTVSYIGAEFLDDAVISGKQSFVITVRVESERPDQDLRHIQQRWYITPRGVALEELPFLTADHVPTKREQFCLKGKKMRDTDNQKQAKDLICRALGIGAADSPLGKKFCAVFPMGTSMDDIADFREFIFQYILPQSEIDPQALQQEQVELDHLNDVLFQAKARAQLLADIAALGETARAKQKDCTVNRGFILCAKQQETVGREEALRGAISEGLRRIEQLQIELRQQEDRAEQAHRLWMDASRENQDSVERQQLKVFEDLVNEREKDYTEARKALSSLQNAKQKLSALNRSLAAHGRELPAEQLPEAIEKLPERCQMDRLSGMERLLAEREGVLDQEAFHTRSKLESLKSRKAALEKQIETLKKGQLIYPDNDRANEVCQAINQEFSRQGMEPDARILCEILTVQEPDWQECVEACLGNRRFDILVSPEHYRTAKRVFEQLRAEVGQVSLLDSHALNRDTKQDMAGPQPNTLASKVTSENWMAKHYVRSLLEQIVCCDASETLENYPHSATRDLLRHFPYRLARLRTPVLFIGLEARKQQLKAARAEYAALQEQLSDLSRQSGALQGTLDQCRQILHSGVLEELRKNWGSERRQQACWQELERARQEYEVWKSNPILQAKITAEQMRQEEWKRQDEKRVSVASSLHSQEAEVEKSRAQQDQIRQNAEIARQEWEKFCGEEPFLQAEIEKKYQDAARVRPPEKIVEYQTNYQNQVNKALEEWLRDHLVPKQREYNTLYTCDYPLGMEGIDTFREQLERLVHVDLERYATSLHQAQERCRQRFREDILYRMKDDIFNAKRQFRDLNRAMENLQYGEEVYQFVIRPNPDPELQAFYDVIMQDGNRRIRGDGSFEDLLARGDEAYEAQVNELMERILAELKANAESRQEGKERITKLSSYVDYRNYLEYDIECRNQVTGGVTRLSAVSQDSSGGENQAPFYIAICASLLQIYDQCENSVRLVLLDEAFSRMTSDRIRPMMQMLRQMRLQVVLITTVEKASAIQPYCDVTCSIIKSGTRNAVSAFYQEVL